MLLDKFGKVSKRSVTVAGWYDLSLTYHICGFVLLFCRQRGDGNKLMMNGGKTKGLDGKTKLSLNSRYCTIFVVFRIDFAVLILVPLNISRSPWEK